MARGRIEIANLICRGEEGDKRIALTQLDEKAALLAIDLQKGIVGAVESGAEVVRRAAELVRAFRAKGLPVVLVNVAGAPRGRREMGRAFARVIREAGRAR